jgi:hypothetical protein
MNDWKVIFSKPRPAGQSKNKWFDEIAKEQNTTTGFVQKHYYTYHHHPAVAKEADKVGIPVESISHYWYKGKQFSIFSKNNQKTYFDVRDEIVQSIKEHAPEFNTHFNYQTVKDPHLLVIDPADIHIGKLAMAIETGENYNVDLALERIYEGIDGLLSKTSGFTFDKILLIIGNDILHTDNAKRTTTSGTSQDTDGMWYSNFLIAKDLYVKVINKLIPIAKTTVQYDPSNHDYTHGFFLADTLSSWFSKCEAVEFNVTPSHRKYFRYGFNLIGTTHGDGAKESDLPLLMAQEASEYWHECRHRYFYTHHIHHKKAKEYGSVTVESLRSPSGTDSWHHRNGYQHAAKAIEAYIHHPENGQIARFTHIF